MSFRYSTESHAVDVGDGAATFLNFTLSPRNLEEWSVDYDFNIQENLKDDGYMGLEEVSTTLNDLSNDHPTMMIVSTLGQSTGHKDILEVTLTSDIRENNADKLHVGLIGGLPGDQPIGTEMLVRFIRHLLIGERGECEGEDQGAILCKEAMLTHCTSGDVAVISKHNMGIDIFNIQVNITLK